MKGTLADCKMVIDTKAKEWLDSFLHRQATN
ncbi:hypothetical protein HDC33_000757 [Sporosarcina sp. JAI121]|nr:hypothetical protein [Sporosarcina sp. JAI121]